MKQYRQREKEVKRQLVIVIAELNIRPSLLHFLTEPQRPIGQAQILHEIIARKKNIALAEVQEAVHKTAPYSCANIRLDRIIAGITIYADEQTNSGMHSHENPHISLYVKRSIDKGKKYQKEQPAGNRIHSQFKFYD